MEQFIENIINWGTTTAGSIISFVVIAYLVYSLKDGFKLWKLLGMFLSGCFLTYIVSDPTKMKEIGQALYSSIFS